MATTNELLAARTFLRRCFPRGGRVLCAVSGGMDSMCLLYFLDTWGRKNGFDVAAAHFNHQLRARRQTGTRPLWKRGAKSERSPALPAAAIPGP